jgi:hypothetical protein
MFYEHAEYHEEYPTDEVMRVGIENPTNKMVFSWGDRRKYLSEHELLNLVTALMMTYEQWAISDIAKTN